jgi:hypothetical protein
MAPPLRIEVRLRSVAWHRRTARWADRTGSGVEGAVLAVASGDGDAGPAAAEVAGAEAAGARNALSFAGAPPAAVAANAATAETVKTRRYITDPRLSEQDDFTLGAFDRAKLTASCHLEVVGSPLRGVAAV